MVSTGDFFDIDSILTNSEKVRCEVLLDCFNLSSIDTGYLHLCSEEDLKVEENMEPEADNQEMKALKENLGVGAGKEVKLGKRDIKKTENDLKVKQNIEIPLWLALGMENYHLLRILTPVWFSADFAKILLADPNGCNLRDKSPFYFEYAVALSDKRYNSMLDHLKFVGEAFFCRAKRLVNLIIYLKETEDHSFLKKLTDQEYAYFCQNREFVQKLLNFTVKKEAGLGRGRFSTGAQNVNIRKQVKQE